MNTPVSKPVVSVRLWMRWVLGLGALTALAAALGWQVFRSSAGDPAALLEDDWYTAHRITARDGSLLRELPAEDSRRGRPVSLDDVGDRLVLATLAAEDARFEDHDGVDRVAILRAVKQNVRHAEVVSGASTITQQLVKLLDTRGTPTKRTLSIKLREAARAQNLEAGASKAEILEAYFHRLPYGHGLVGPDAAARGYFGVAATDLSWAQATFLAVLPRAPSFLDPYDHQDRVRLRQHALLAKMREAEVLTEAQHARALDEPIVVRALEHPFEAPHFVQMLQAESRLQPTGETRTTLDAALQSDVEGLVATHMTTIAERSVDNAAALVVNNTTGDVEAYVGSADFFAPEIAGQVDMVRAQRQPGSALKPFVYGLAFEHGHTAAEMLADVPTQFFEGGGAVYAPRNFHGDYLGPIAAREALAASLNVPVIRLASTLPPGAMLDRLHALGFDSLNRSAAHYGLALALGSGEVRLRELATAYVTLARTGSAIALRYTDQDPPAAGTQVIDRGAAASVAEVLSDPSARLRLLEGRSPFDIGYPVAVKTGTSSGYRDAWTAGFTHEYTVVVWVGNADGSPMHKVTGASGAGPLFADVMRRAMENVSTRGPLWPADALVTAEVCPLSGLPATEACPDAVTRRFPTDAVPTEACGVHVHAHRTVQGYSCDDDGEVIALLPDAFDRWLENLEEGAPGADPHGTPWLSRRDVQGCGETGHRPSLDMTSPSPGAVILLGDVRATRARARDQDRVELRASWTGASAQRPEEIEFVVDGKVVGQSEFPYTVLAKVGPGEHEAYARPTDPERGTAFGAVAFSVR